MNAPPIPIRTIPTHVETNHPALKNTSPNPGTRTTKKQTRRETLLVVYFLTPRVISFPVTPAKAIKLEFRKMFPPRFLIS